MDLKRPKIGLLTLFFDLYLASGDTLLTSCQTFAAQLVEGLGQLAEVVHPGVCANRTQVAAAVRDFEAADVDLIVVVHLTYAPSQYAAPALLRTGIPLLLWSTQKLSAVTETITNWDLEENHGVHGTQDLANVLRRGQRRFAVLAGHWQDATTLQQLREWFEAARIRRGLQSARVGLIGHPMEHMGDFGLDETAFETQLGVHVQHIAQRAIAVAAREAPAEAIRDQLRVDLEHFKAHVNLTDAQHEAAARLEWAIKQTLEREGLIGFASHFFAIAQEGLLDSLPFLAASNLLAAGYGYGGEGDVTSAVAVWILRQLAGEATFTEMFTMDFGGDSLLMSHMGEGNWRLARADHPIILRSDPFDLAAFAADPVSLTFALRPGPATLLNITVGPEGRLQWIVVEGEVVDSQPLPQLTQTHHRFRFTQPVARFVEAYAQTGGSHHQALAYGHWGPTLSRLAGLLDVPFFAL